MGTPDLNSHDIIHRHDIILPRHDIISAWHHPHDIIPTCTPLCWPGTNSPAGGGWWSPKISSTRSRASRWLSRMPRKSVPRASPFLPLGGSGEHNPEKKIEKKNQIFSQDFACENQCVAGQKETFFGSENAQDQETRQAIRLWRFRGDVNCLHERVHFRFGCIRTVSDHAYRIGGFT